MEREVPSKYQQYVVTDLPQSVTMPGHHQAAPSWIVPGMFPGVNIRINGADASKIVQKPHAEPHVHDTNPEIYFSTTEKRGDLVIEVQMDDEIFTVESPFAVFIPPGVKHCFTVLKCDAPNFIYGIHIMDYKG
jgi:mannose-6-phosphate isomerase-like protein (cupin superfamily)